MTVSHATEKLVNNIKSVISEGETQLRENGKLLTEKTREQLSKSLATAKDSCKKAEAEMRVVARRADAKVREHPYAAIGLGAAVGLIIGALLLRRR